MSTGDTLHSARCVRRAKITSRKVKEDLVSSRKNEVETPVL